MNEILNIFGWVAGAGAITWVVLAVTAPSLLQIAASWLSALSPLVKGLAEGLVEVAKRLWNGLTYLAGNFNAVLFVLLFGAGVYTYGSTTSSKDLEKACESRIEELRKDYKFIKRTKEERKNYLKTRKGTSSNGDWWNPLSWGN